MSQKYIIGFPRIGEKRELKFALEDFWANKSSFEEVEAIAKDLRKRHWNYQHDLGIEFIASNDFSYYDGMLDTIVMLGAIPKRFRDIEDKTKRYFTMARGDELRVAMEMTKWFNTNYHYIVPELSIDTPFKADISKIIQEYREAKALGITTKINLIGPLTFLVLSNKVDGGDTFGLFDKVLEAYKKVVQEIAKLDDEILIQFEEPIFAKDVEPKLLSLLKIAYDTLGSQNKNVKLAVITYFDHSCEATEVLSHCPIWAIGLDFVHGSENRESIHDLQGKKLIVGIVDGRNVWKNNIPQSLEFLQLLANDIGKENIIVSTSCSLLHVPFTLKYEEKMDTNVKEKLCFALEKLDEVVQICDLFAQDKAFIGKVPLSNSWYQHTTSFPYLRAPYATRYIKQQESLNLPSLPTTTIGSFPQTKEARSLRNDYKKGLISKETYEKSIQKAIQECVTFQEELGLDVLVHGEFERNDMVEYFGELLEGFAFSQNGWVQSYGSRCVKPPLLHSSVERKAPMTLDWTLYAQSLTCKPMKGMLTGPVTILNWAFVRSDIPKREVAFEVAKAIAQEIDDLQKNGIKIIQVDEAAFKEGYPLRADKIKAYEQWALESFKASVSKAWDETQIHTHMCYSDFNDIIDTIEQMDADVITIETSRSGNRLLKVFQKVNYQAQIGPGVYDIHSPRVPSVEEMVEQIKAFLEVFPKEKLWINPDCGLKTRGWSETKEALKNMISAVKLVR